VPQNILQNHHCKAMLKITFICKVLTSLIKHAIYKYGKFM